MSDKAEKSVVDPQTVVDALRDAGATRGCPRCGNDSFRILAGYLCHSIQSDTRGIQIGGPGISTWALVCNRCGFVSQHAIDVLTGTADAEPVRH
ncbi:MAG: hypothetical protein IT350_14145 [Deltaproteobacteria bacterium]|nr:hypothetical protein [Deltaproteobacteria bacterium]